MPRITCFLRHFWPQKLRSRYFFEQISILATLCPPPHVTYLWISVQIRVRTHERNLILLSREFGKGQYTLYHMKSSLFAKKNELRKKCWNFIRWKGEPLQSRSTIPLTPLEYWICSSKPGQIGLKLFKRKSPCPEKLSARSKIGGDRSVQIPRVKNAPKISPLCPSWAVHTCLFCLFYPAPQLATT